MALSQSNEDSEIVEAVNSAKDSEALLALRKEFIERLANLERPSCSRALALLMHDCREGFLSKWRNSSLWLERCAIAQNPHTPKEILQELAKDVDGHVRAAAQWRSET